MIAPVSAHYKCIAVLEVPSASDIPALQAGWRADDPFAALREEGVTRYVRGLSIASDVPGMAPRGRLGIAHLWVPDHATAIAVNARLRSGAVHARNPALAAARIIAMPVLQSFVLGPVDDYGSGGLRACFLVKGLDELGPAGFHNYWRAIHGPLLHGQPGFTRYAQQHRLYASYDDDMVFDGLTEISHPDEAGALAFGADGPNHRLQVIDSPKVFDQTVGKRFFSRDEIVF
jgi:hypothetical protein